MKRNPNVEMNKLIKLLCANNIPFEVYSFPAFSSVNGDFGIQIFSPSLADNHIDAVCHWGTYGYEQGLIEIMSIREEDVVGWLTAEEALPYFVAAQDDNHSKEEN